MPARGRRLQAPILGLAICSLAVFSGAALVASAPAAHSSLPACKNGGVLIVFARGSQPQATFSAGEAASFRTNVQLRLRGTPSAWVELGDEDDNSQLDIGGYPAVFVPDWISGNPNYANSVSIGTTQLVALLNRRYSPGPAGMGCKDEVAVLGGYSQGADVLGNVLASGHLTPTARAHVAFVALYADPQFLCDPTLSIVRGSVACGTAIGGLRQLVPRNPYVPTEFIGRVGSWCDRDDGVCTSEFGMLPPPLGFGSHSSTAYSGVWIPASADEIAVNADAALRRLNPSSANLQTSFSENMILRNSETGTSWLVGAGGYRHWIPTGGDYLCFVAQGSPVINLKQSEIDAIPDRVGSHAVCTPSPTVPPSRTAGPTATPHPTPSPTPSGFAAPAPVRTHGKADFNGDGYSDFVIFAGGQWAVKSGKGPHDYIAQGIDLGKDGDEPFVGDFNGDGVPDFAISSGGQWAVRSGVNPYTYVAQGIQLGGPGSTPVVGDFNGDGTADFGIYAGGQWAVKSGRAPYDYVSQGIRPGTANSWPLVGDFNADGYSDYATYESGVWAVRSGQSPDSFVAQGVQLGGPGSRPLTGDFNGDGRSDFVIYTGGTWAVKSAVDQHPYIAQGVTLGTSSTTPFVGYFNTDNVADFTIYDNGVWAAKSGGESSYPYAAQGVQLGGNGSQPLTG